MAEMKAFKRSEVRATYFLKQTKHYPAARLPILRHVIDSLLVGKSTHLDIRTFSQQSIPQKSVSSRVI